jgi:adenylate cyclase
MGIEIEHKYLIDKQKLFENFNPEKTLRIRQGYLSEKPAVRIRLVNFDRAYITIKSSGAISVSEFEYEIPRIDGEQLLNMCSDIISKTRYEIIHAGNIWEVDEFHHSLKGLWVAEIELDYESEKYDKPVWVTKDVSLDKRYKNTQLSKFGIPK